MPYSPHIDGSGIGDRMTAQPLDADEFAVRVKAGEAPENLPEGYDIVGIEGDADWDYFILRRINA